MNQKNKKKKITRRAFIITGSIAGGGLIVGLGGMTYINRKIKVYPEYGLGDGISLNAWVRIRPDNKIGICVPRSEMGQGVYTSLPMLIAEELELDLSQIEVIQPQLGSPYTNLTLGGTQRDVHKSLSFIEKVFHMVPQVATGGSTSVRDAYDQYRIIGATTREMLISAAAKKWGIERSMCHAENAVISRTDESEVLKYSELAETAVLEEPLENPPLKQRSEFKLIGKPVPRIDIREKVTGQANFGMDIRLPGMLFAAIKHPAIAGAKMLGINNRERVEGMEGVVKVIQLPNAAAVVADNTWRALNGTRILDLEIDSEGNDSLSSAEIMNQLQESARGEPKYNYEKEGEIIQLFEEANSVIEAEYTAPYLAHACMEPLNTTVLVEDGKAEVWSGNQSPLFVVNAVKEGSGVSKKNITVHIPYLGGGFGRRAEKDFVLQAARIAKEMKGTPVQLVWSREEDMRNDMYRPAAVSCFKASLDQDGNITAWQNNVACQSAIIGLMKRNVGFMVPKKKDDESSIEGAAKLPYNFRSRSIGFNILDFPVNVGTWRSVGHSQNAFFSECFMDELAVEAAEDPWLFRKKHCMHHERFCAVMDKAAAFSNWTRKGSENHFKGIAVHESFGSFVAEVVEIKKVSEHEFSLENIYCVIDCGVTVNPDTIEAQMQSGIVFALSAALFGKITLKDGAVEQYNFPQYDMIRLKEMPRIHVHIMDNEENPGGVGEPAVPPLAPALCNSLFAATGKRIRSLPLVDHGIRFI